MSQYILKSLKAKSGTTNEKILGASGKSWVNAQFSTRYVVVDAATGLPPKKLVLRKSGVHLVIQDDDVVLVSIRKFFADTRADAPATYQVDKDCQLGEGKSDESGEFYRDPELIIGGAKSHSSSGQGVIWRHDTGICADVLPSQPHISPVIEVAPPLDVAHKEVAGS